jgi:hypothetical protein
VRAGCGDKPHVRFGRGGLVLLSNQDPAFYLTSEPGKAWYRAKDGRWMRHLGSRGKVVRCVNPCRYGCQRTQKLESRMLRKRARPVRRGEGRFGLSEIPPECSGGSEAQTVPRWPPTLPQRDFSKLCSAKWLYKQSQFHRLLAMSWNHSFIAKSTTATKDVREPPQSHVHLVAQPVGVAVTRYDFMRLWKSAPGTTYRDSTRVAIRNLGLISS